MDVFAHGLWSAIVFSGQPRTTAVRGIMWGVAPDLIPFTGSLLLMPLTGFDRTSFLMVYPFTHSLVLFVTVLLIATAVLRSFPLPMLAWGLHILADIPGHRRFLTPFLFPLSDFRVFGWWEWLSPQMLLINYTVMVSIIVFLWLRRRYVRRAQAEVLPPASSAAAR